MGELESTTGAASRLSALSPAKRAYLERLRAGRDGDPRPRSRDEPVPLSFAQERLWFLGLLDPDSTAYTLFYTLRTGALDLDALERALNTVVERHEVLRTGFETVDGAPAAVVAADARLVLERHDLRAAEDPVAAAEAVAVALVGMPFDLARPPLVRAAAARLRDGETAVLLSFHHLVLDAWSVGVLLGELGESYRAVRAGRPPALPRLAVQYGDYAIWQRRHLAGQQLEDGVAHWREVLRGSQPLALPADHPRPDVLTERGAREPIVVDAAAAEALRTLAQAEHTSLFMCMLAVYAVLLGRWSGQGDLLVGTPVEGRTRAELEGLIGLFLNTVVLRIPLDGEPTFRELLRRVRAVALDAFSHAEVPFERLVRELAPDRLLSRTPIFQTMFQLQTPGHSLPFGRVQEERPIEVSRSRSLYELSLDLLDGPTGLRGRLEYSTDLFAAATVARMARAYETLAVAAARDPDLPIGRLPLLADTDRASLAAWNDTAAPLPDAALHDLVAAQAERTPAAAALVAGPETVTYAELLERADRFAARLASAGAGPGHAVALLLGRGPDLVVAELAVLRTGAAVFPLDPGTPAGRLAALLEQAAPVLVVAGRDRLEQLPPGAPGSSEVAAVFATSGTTGSAKLVEVPHRALVNHAQAVAAAFGLGPGDRVMQLASPGFDVQLEEIFPTLLAGAAVVAPDRNGLLGLDELAATVERHAVTVLNVPTPLWHDWLLAIEDGLARLPPSLRLVVVGSDRMVPEDLARWWALPAPRPRLVQAYGVTEAAITSLVHEVPEGAGPREADVIGRPLANVAAHVLDRLGQPQPIGVPGELFLGGAGLASGYRGDAAGTAAAFGAFAEGSGERLYRTGDRVVRRGDGTLRFLGRLDDQVKVRGVRVEPEEVAARLRAHPGVRDAVVRMRDGALAAWIVPGGPGGAAGGRAAHAPRTLASAAAVPASFTQVTALPRTAHGKLDLAALPGPEADEPVQAAAPGTATEAAVAALWRELLGRDHVGRDENFFDLGGHSLLLVRAHARLAAGAPDLTIVALFRYPTVRTLAAHLDSR